jgi:glycosyltransferase involved in cell wall biosynthesis
MYPLIIVGNLLKTKYVDNLTKSQNGNIRFLGGIYNREILEALRFSCKAYFHGHSVGGTNPTLLEALGSRNIVIAHDNVFNREVTDNKMFYFKNAKECAACINNVESLSVDQIIYYKQLAVQRIVDYYNWDRITNEYLNNFIKINNENNI